MEEKNDVVLEYEQKDAPKKRSFFSRLKAKKQKKLQQLESETLTEEESKKVEEKMEEATKEVSSKSEKKKKIRNVIFLIFNLVLVAAILIWNVKTSDDFTPLSLLDIKFQYIAVIVAFLFLAVSMDVLSTHRMIYRKTLRSRWHLAYKASATLRYYDAITPMATGGQAFMVTYMTSRDVPAPTALSVPIAKLLFQNVAWLIITFVCLIVSFTSHMPSLVSAASIIGFVLGFVVVFAILFLSISKRAGKKLVAWVLKLLVKMHILKDFDKHYAKVWSFVEDYQNIFREYKHAKLDIVYQLILHALRNVCVFSVPYFIYIAFPHSLGTPVATFGEFFVYTAMIDLASSFIPLPGGTGMNEITFQGLFNPYFVGTTFWALLVWRFVTYYYYLLQGLGVMAYDSIYGNRKYRWVKKRYELQFESQQFKRNQIETFRQERDSRRKKIKKNKTRE